MTILYKIDDTFSKFFVKKWTNNKPISNKLTVQHQKRFLNFFNIETPFQIKAEPLKYKINNNNSFLISHFITIKIKYQ